MTSEYLVPSWKVWAASTERTSSTGSPHRGQGSPVATSTKEPHRSTVKSRPRTTPLTWWSARLAPAIQRPGRRTPSVGDHREPIALVPHRSEEPLDQAGMGGEVAVLEEAPARRQAGLPVTGEEQDDRGPGVVDDGEALQQVAGSDIRVGEVARPRRRCRHGRGVVLGQGGAPPIGARRPRARVAARGRGQPPRSAASTLAA